VNIVFSCWYSQCSVSAFLSMSMTCYHVQLLQGCRIYGYLATRVCISLEVKGLVAFPRNFDFLKLNLVAFD